MVYWLVRVELVALRSVTLAAGSVTSSVYALIHDPCIYHHRETCSIVEEREQIFHTHTHTHTHAAVGWDAVGGAGNSMYLNGRIHTLSYQRIPPHPIPTCVWNASFSLKKFNYSVRDGVYYRPKYFFQRFTRLLYVNSVPVRLRKML